ncbi:hypothetical protein BC943DRAFT_320154, partial [Umbelopsis sp. AD052]
MKYKLVALAYLILIVRATKWKQFDILANPSWQAGRCSEFVVISRAHKIHGRGTSKSIDLRMDAREREEERWMDGWMDSRL